MKNSDRSAGRAKKQFSENEIFFVLGGAHRGRKASGTPGVSPSFGSENITCLESNVVCWQVVIGLGLDGTGQNLCTKCPISDSL